MCDIWVMQLCFECCVGKVLYKLLEYLCLCVGFDFLLLCCQFGEFDVEFGEWWEVFIVGNGVECEELIVCKLVDSVSSNVGFKKCKCCGGCSCSKLVGDIVEISDSVSEQEVIVLVLVCVCVFKEVVDMLDVLVDVGMGEVFKCCCCCCSSGSVGGVGGDSVLVGDD